MTEIEREIGRSWFYGFDNCRNKKKQFGSLDNYYCFKLKDGGNLLKMRKVLTIQGNTPKKMGQFVNCPNKNFSKEYRGSTCKL
jgi:hypothetical protein